MWAKYADEIKYFPAEWDDLVAGDPISGVVTVEAVGDLDGVTPTILATVGNLSTVKVIGGTAGQSGFLRFTINTVGGQIFRPQNSFRIAKRLPIT